MGAYFGFIGVHVIIGIYINICIYLVASCADSFNGWCCFWDQNKRHWLQGATIPLISWLRVALWSGVSLQLIDRKSGVIYAPLIGGDIFCHTGIVIDYDNGSDF